MTREDRAMQILRVKRSRGDRVIGRMAMIGSFRCLQEDVGRFVQRRREAV
jgi:hypothetical protein